MPSILDSASKKLTQIEESHRLRKLAASKVFGGMQVERGGKMLTSFSSNDYLGLSQHPALTQASHEAIEEYGAGAGAARLVSGNHPLYAQLESELAAWKQTESSLVLGSGYLANMGIIPALVGDGDLIVADKLVHACMIDGAQLSGANLQRFPHNDMEAANRLLEKHRGNHEKCLILTESIFSMDGDAGHTEDLYALTKQYDALLLVDDAHGLGVINGGKGQPYLGEHMLLMGTFSKAAGSYGGYVCGSKVLIDYLINTVRSFIFSTALPPATIAASLAAVRIMRDDASVNALLWRNINQLRDALKLQDTASAIIPIILGDDEKAIHMSETLSDAGFFVSAIRPPTVPPGTARLRITLSAAHTHEQIEALARVMKGLCA